MARRSQKLFAAGCVLTVGLLLATPFRKTESPPPRWPLDLRPAPIVGDSASIAASSTLGLSEIATLPLADRRGAAGTRFLPVLSSAPSPAAAAPVAKSVDSVPGSVPHATGEASVASTGMADDVAKPAPETNLFGGTIPIDVATTSAEEPAPAGVVYSTVSGYAPLDVEDDEQPSEFRRYVVHDGDTLGRLAERYLGDAARAVELFDLNRDVLANPHLLPIGVEIRIPRGDHLRLK
ncbi:MAG: hypothetical protein KDA61_20600 [Planctomycetales bacterium]|nr:hypothetical protein [Planctomycetales bacterium]